MTIDEAIECERNHRLYPEYHGQLAEWLEELKKIKSNGRYVQGNKAGQKIGYNKAIDDFAEKLKAECIFHYVDCDPYFGGTEESILYEDDIDEIAEQLKAGEAE